MASFKKGPNCGPCGSYACQNLAFVCDGCGHAVFTDRCLTEEIRAIRSKGVRTLGCCCGHGEKLGYIQVMPEDVPIMELLGYEQQQEIELEDGSKMGVACFTPKTDVPQENDPERWEDWVKKND